LCCGRAICFYPGMRRGLIGSAILTAAFGAAGLLATGHASPADPPGPPAIIERFFTTDGRAPSHYRALRRLDAQNGQFDKRAWMDVWTEADENGFRYEVAAEGGSGYIRSKVFLPALETERKMWGAEGPGRSAISPANYHFEDRGEEPTGLARVALTAKRKDVLLVNGSIFLRPEDGDLVRIQGALTKTPSFWTRKVEISRRYERIAGVRLPVEMESTASILIAGRSTFTMTYEYESVNGETIGRPEPRVP
jgi:hypothetical protein